MSRAATAGELVLFRTEKQRSKIRAAIFSPSTIYQARINQTFSTLDQVLEITYDNGSGTLANVKADMTLLIGSSAGAYDIGIVRIRSVDATKFYIQETSDVSFANDQYLTVIDDFGLYARPVLITAGVPYMDGGVTYTNQHTNFDPTPIMGSNRVLKLTGASVSAVFNGASSYCLDSSITAYSWSAPGSSSSSGMTTATPTITWNAVGWYLVYLTLTAANGKVFFGVRYVYVWSEASQPPSAQIGDCRVDVESGGWSADITLFDNADLTTVRDHALVILFAEDYYGATAQSIGPVTGCENILFTGWIAKEQIDWNPEQGQVRFTAYTAQYFMSQIPSWPDGVEFTTAIPAAWTEIQNLTINKGVWHFLHWRTTATRVMDVFLTDDTKYTKEVRSLAQNLWEQLREMTFLQIFARPGVNALNQLYVEVHPQLVPTASRTWPTVMTITKPDWQGDINFERVTMNQVSILNLSGVNVNSSGVGAWFFSLSTGHAHTHYGRPEIQDQLLLDSQAQSNALCGLYYGWRNNPYPDIPITFSANNRLIDCFPRQKCTIVIAAGDTPRGITYSGNIIPTSVAYVHDPETGRLHTETTFEAETFPALSTNGDVPGSGDTSIPPSPPLPPIPPLPIIIPGGFGEPDPDAVIPCLLHSTGYGMLYTANINTANPQWITVNSGLTSTQYTQVNLMFRTPNGAFYAVYYEVTDTPGGKPFFIARAPSIGGTFTVLYSEETIRPSPSTGLQWGIFAAAYNPLVSESVGFVMGTVGVDKKFWIGAGSSFSAGALITDSPGYYYGGLSYGLGFWLYATYDHFSKIAPGGGSVVASGNKSTTQTHARASTTGRTFHNENGGTANLIVGENNLATTTLIDLAQNILLEDAFAVPPYFACDPTGTYMMTRFDTGAKGKSSDVGATWSALGSLPPGNWWFSYAGGVGTASWWIAAGGSSVRLSKDFGTTWLNREGNLLSVAPIPNLNMVKAVI